MSPLFFVSPLPGTALSSWTGCRPRSTALCRHTPGCLGKAGVAVRRAVLIPRACAGVDTSDPTTPSPSPSSPPPSTAVSPPTSASTDDISGDSEADLRYQQMSAYFQGSETQFQPGLASVSRLALRNFVGELEELLATFRRLLGLDPPQRFTPPDILGLRLSDEAVNNREREREFADGVTGASGIVRFVYTATCNFLDLFFANRPIPRFWYLETVARMPYFAYSSCLHLYSTLGWYRSPTIMNMHHAEELNEAYHLAIMESLGGDKLWTDRFAAFHTSLLYYWFLVILFLFSPAQSYQFSQLIESHAVDTYTEFLETNEEVLRQLPVPEVAHDYYSNFLYYFYEIQISSGEGEGDALRSRPTLKSLYDVFDNILRDEKEHSKTMIACTDFVLKDEPFAYNGTEVSATSRSKSRITAGSRQQFWKKWSKLDARGRKEGSEE